MPSPARLACLLPTDRLHRKLRIGQWDPATSEVDPTAFVDPEGRPLSMYVAGVGRTPREILAHFCTYAYAKKLCPPGEKPTPEHLVAAGEGVLEISAAEVFRLGIAVKLEANGDQIRADGHINLVGYEEFAIDLAEAARALPLQEVLK